MSQVESNLRLSQLHPLRPSHTDQSQGSKLSLTDTHTDRISISRSTSAYWLWDLKTPIVFGPSGVRAPAQRSGH
jgi:hypothetical protein